MEGERPSPSGQQRGPEPQPRVIGLMLLVLVTVVAWSLLRGSREGFVWAFFGGLALDLISSGPLGVSSIALLVVCALAGLTEGHVQSHSILLAVSSAALGTLAFEAIVLLSALAAGHSLGPFRQVAELTLSSLVLNVAFMPPVHWLMRRLYLAAEQSEVRLNI